MQSLRQANKKGGNVKYPCLKIPNKKRRFKMAKIVKGKYPYKEDKSEAKKLENRLNNEKVTTVRNFVNDEKKNVIHGSNIRAYHNDFPKRFCKELEIREEKIKDKILKYSTDDAGNIECFIKAYGKYVKYNCDDKHFYVWTGRLWLKDTQNIVPLWCLTVMKARRDYTRDALHGNSSIVNYDDLLRHAKKCANQSSIRALVEGLKSTLSCDSSIFDNDPSLLNVLNGTIDLKTGKLYEHDHKKLITKLIPVMYNPNAESKIFDKFLKDTFEDTDLIHYVHRLFGYCVTGETSEQVVHFFIGTGANGKSTVLSAIRYVMDDYAAVVPSKVLIDRERSGSTSSEIAQLPHKRLVCCSELNCTDALNEGKFKIMSSGETISARELFNSAFTYDPEFKFIIDTNYLPIVNGTDHGIWRRIRIVPFDHTVSKSELNKNLLNELKRDSQAILNWLVKGAMKYYSQGLGSCSEVEKATKGYRKSQDTLGSFIDSCIKKEDGAEVRARTLYEAYCEFCSDNLLSSMSETKFGKDFASRGYKKGKDKLSRKYLDIKLKNIC